MLPPLLYSAAATGHTTFNDITVGNNDYTGTNGGLYPATTAYDLATGFGLIKPLLPLYSLATNSRSLSAQTR